jgi:hypothetical protein
MYFRIDTADTTPACKIHGFNVYTYITMKLTIIFASQVREPTEPRAAAPRRTQRHHKLPEQTPEMQHGSCGRSHFPRSIRQDC